MSAPAWSPPRWTVLDLGSPAKPRPCPECGDDRPAAQIIVQLVEHYLVKFKEWHLTTPLASGGAT